jgi:hypothetical protein
VSKSHLHLGSSRSRPALIPLLTSSSSTRVPSFIRSCLAEMIRVERSNVCIVKSLQKRRLCYCNTAGIQCQELLKLLHTPHTPLPANWRTTSPSRASSSMKPFPLKHGITRRSTPMWPLPVTSTNGSARPHRSGMPTMVDLHKAEPGFT